MHYTVFLIRLKAEPSTRLSLSKKEDKEVDEYAKKNGAKVIYDDSGKFEENIYSALLEAKGDYFLSER